MIALLDAQYPNLVEWIANNFEIICEFPMFDGNRQYIAVENSVVKALLKLQNQCGSWSQVIDRIKIGHTDDQYWYEDPWLYIGELHMNPPITLKSEKDFREWNKWRTSILDFVRDHEEEIENEDLINLI